MYIYLYVPFQTVLNRHLDGGGIIKFAEADGNRKKALNKFFFFASLVRDFMANY